MNDNQRKILINKIARAPRSQRKQSSDSLGYDYDDELSHDNWAVLVNRNTKKPVVVYRPTKITNTRDLQADIDIVKGTLKENRLYKEAVTTRHKVADKYQQKPEHTGFSLGGTLADYVGRETGDEAVAFNPGSNMFRREKPPKNVRVVRSHNDPISYGYSGLDPISHYIGIFARGPEGHAFDLLTGGHDLEAAA